MDVVGFFFVGVLAEGVDCLLYTSPAILIQKNTTIIDLQKRFVGYLPIDVLSILVNEIQKLVA